MCECVAVCVCVHAHVPGSDSNTSYLLQEQCAFFLVTGSFDEPGNHHFLLAWLAIMSQGTFSVYMQRSDYGSTTRPSFLLVILLTWGSRDLNSGPHGFTANTFLT